jgi:hypothetical protein
LDAVGAAVVVAGGDDDDDPHAATTAPTPTPAPATPIVVRRKSRRDCVATVRREWFEGG